MRRVVIIVAVLLGVFLIGWLSATPVITIIARKQLENVFNQSRVEIGSVDFQPMHRLGFSNIVIRRQGNYEIKVKEAAIVYSIFPLMRSGSLHIVLRGVTAYGVEADDAALSISLRSGLGYFKIAGVKYDKLMITGIAGNMKYDSMAVALYGVRARALDGNLRGDGNLSVGKEPRYFVRLSCADLDIVSLVRDFDLGKKFEMTGRVSGQAVLKGSGMRVEEVSGHFSTLAPGGILTIHDTESLAKMAADTQQPVDLFIEGFKNYQYDTGMMSLGVEGGNVSMQVGLDGDTGKRDLNIVLHGFKL